MQVACSVEALKVACLVGAFLVASLLVTPYLAAYRATHLMADS